MGKLFSKGIYTKGEYSSKIGGKNTNEYQIWRDMLRRCYSPESLKKQPSYSGCSVEGYLLDFQNFAKWVTHQIGYGLPKYHMDKDIMFDGNKIYSREAIVFVPKELNVFLTSSAAKRGKWPQGVSWKIPNKQFVAQITQKAVVTYLGLYQSLRCAMIAYSNAKTDAGREWGRRLRDGEFIVDERVTVKMENYKFTYKESECS